MRWSFDRRILRYIYGLAPDFSNPLSVAALLVRCSPLRTASSGTLWDFAENSPEDGDDHADTVSEPSTDGIPPSGNGEKNPGGDDGDPPNEGTEDERENAEKCAIIYVRVSTNEQTEHGRSLDSQEEELESIVEADPNMRTYIPKPVRDEGESGTDFDRDGIQRVAELAHNEEVTHLLVDTVDRIGRSVAETIMFIEHLRKNCDVKLRTRSREFDVLKPTDKLQVTMLATMADFGTMNRIRSAHRSKADNFLKERNWSSWYGDSIPIGYTADEEAADDDEDSSGPVWIKPVPWMETVIEDVYEAFLETERYADARDEVNRKHGRLIARYFESEDIESEENKLTRHQVKRIVSRPVYKGEPTLPVDSLNHYDPYPSVEDPTLALVTEEIFEKAQEIIGRLQEKFSSHDELTFSPADYSDEFGPFLVDTVSPLVQLRCPHCEGDLASNGQYLVDGQHASRIYKCTGDECNFQQRWPKESERDMMKMLVNLDEFQSIL